MLAKPFIDQLSCGAGRDEGDAKMESAETPPRAARRSRLSGLCHRGRGQVDTVTYALLAKQNSL